MLTLNSLTSNLLSILTAILIFSNAGGQVFPNYLKEHAVKIERLDSLNKQVYNLLSDNRLIMIGEMHGTNEPAKFVTGLAKLFADHDDSVQVGFEIPSSQMTAFSKSHTDKSIFQSGFFSQRSTDGRASIAWATAISVISKISKAQIFFYDVNEEDFSDRRDSVMYLNIKSKLLEHPTWKTITLSGNIHNMLLPFRGENKTANYLSNDIELNLEDNLCSLNHRYQKGTANNNRGNGLQIYDMGNIETEYSTTVNFDNYLFLFPINYNDKYDGIFFTRIISAAKLANQSLGDAGNK
ncbi:MAG: hypothetical protein JJE25_07530 [Bacteroidia bacterium]|nr:hypothetical protein [Bacteroidia bacterium]